MNVQEWALVTFTILAQMAVGAFIVLGVLHSIAVSKAGLEQADRLADYALLAIGPVLVLGLGASTLHLGSPQIAYRAVANLGSSWLSREIVFGTLFAAAGAAFAFMQWRKLASASMRRVVALVATAFGVGLVYSMGRVYLLRTVPVWNTDFTPVMFFVTTFLLGSMAIGAAFVATNRYLARREPGNQEVQAVLLRGSLRWIAIVSMFLLGIEFVAHPMRALYLGQVAGPASQSAALLIGPFGILSVLRLALVFAGAGLLGVFIYQNASSAHRERVAGTLAYAAFALALIGEVLGRFLFYATYARVGL